MLQLQKTFCNTKRGSLSITDYCLQLKNFHVALNDVDSKLDEVELVMQILHSSPPSNQSIIVVITNKQPFPIFLEAKKHAILPKSLKDNSNTSFDPLVE